MKRTQKRLSLIAILFLTILTSCEENLIEPESNINLKSLMKETVMFSLELDNYKESNEGGFLFNSDRYNQEIVNSYKYFAKHEINLSNIQYSGQTLNSFKNESFQEHPEEFHNFHQELLNISQDQVIGYSEKYFEELEKLAYKIAESNLKIESKHALLNSIQFSYIAYEAIDELSNEFPVPTIASKSIANGIQSGCKFNWNDVLKTALTDMAWGGSSRGNNYWYSGRGWWSRYCNSYHRFIRSICWCKYGSCS